jgi:glycosyltransferase involved in cell wall biosynthesis
VTDPDVTIIMAVRNELLTIEEALDSALRQVCRYVLEVVVADGCSDDGTAEVLTRRVAADPRVRVVANQSRTTAAGLNAALAAARGQYWVRLDGHSVLPPDYVARLVDHIRAGRCEAAGGVVRARGTTRFGRAVAAAQDSRFGIGNASHHYATREGFVDHVAHGAYRVDRSRSIGGFDEALIRNQDYDFDFRYRANGARILIDPSIEFHRQARETPAALMHQYYQYGYWKYVVFRRHPTSLHVRWLAPPTLVAALGIGTLTSGSRFGRRLLGTTLTAYLALVTLGTATIARRRGCSPYDVGRALATMHLAWGAGFLRSALSGL